MSSDGGNALLSLGNVTHQTVNCDSVAVRTAMWCLWQLTKHNKDRSKNRSTKACVVRQ